MSKADILGLTGLLASIEVVKGLLSVPVLLGLIEHSLVVTDDYVAEELIETLVDLGLLQVLRLGGTP